MCLDLSFENEEVLWTRVMEEKNSGNVAVITVMDDKMILGHPQILTPSTHVASAFILLD